MVDPVIQKRLSSLAVAFNPAFHDMPGVDSTFKPWLVNLSPSALYNCSLICRKSLKQKTPETKWVSLKRWTQTTPSGYTLPEGIFLSIKRREQFMSTPTPHFEKGDYIILMFPYGNVWPLTDSGKPITESWMFEMVGGKTNLEHLHEHDASHPLIDYFGLCHKYMVDNPDQIGIHLKRKKKSE